MCVEPAVMGWASLRSACALVMLVVGAHSAHAGPAPTVLAGRDGQTYAFTVPPAGLTLRYTDRFEAPRLPGPDGTVGGWLLVDGTGARLSGELLYNLPGNETSLVVNLQPATTEIELARGQYRLVMLGDARRIPLPLSGGPLRQVVHATGTARDTLQAWYGTGDGAHTWRQPLRADAGGFVFVMTGSSASGPAAAATFGCLAAADSPLASLPCQDSQHSRDPIRHGGGSGYTLNGYYPGTEGVGYTASGDLIAYGQAATLGAVAVRSVVAVQPVPAQSPRK